MNWRLALALPAAFGLIYTGFIERMRLICDRHVVAVNGGSDLHLRILHISDVHMSGRSPFRRWRLHRWASAIERCRFDLLVFSGDLVDDAAGVELGAAFLRRVARDRPIYAVHGNHDYHNYSMWENILNVHTLHRLGLVPDIPINGNLARTEAIYARHGITVLTNEGRLLRHNGVEFWLAGVDDLMLGSPDLNRAIQGAPPDVPRVLIAHNPDLFPWAEMAGFDLILSGHTHGGQIRLPLLGPIVTRSALNKELSAGLTRNSHGALHVSHGLGETIPLRFRCPPQATIIELVGE